MDLIDNILDDVVAMPRRQKVKTKISIEKPEVLEAPEVLEEAIVDCSEFENVFGKPAGYHMGEPIDRWRDTGWVGNFHFDWCLSVGLLHGASDIHISSDESIAFTVKREIIKYEDMDPMNEDESRRVALGVLKNVADDAFKVNKDAQHAYEIRFGKFKGRRFRVSAGFSKGKRFFVLRTLDSVIPEMRKLGINEELRSWGDLAGGMWLICGETGSGKTSTLASIIRDIQLHQRRKIITIEYPIEFIYPSDGLGLITQREVGMDCKSFYNGLTAAMRQNPDIILIGEVRDTEEVSELLRASESGHLAISTMHTKSAASTVNRIIGLFDGDERLRILSTLADNLKGVCNQILVRKKDGNMIAVREILSVNREVEKYIISGDVSAIRAYQLKHEITMEDNLARLVLEGVITKEVAFNASKMREDLVDIFKKNGI